MRLTKYNPETGQYEYIEKAKTLDEVKAQRKAVIQRLGELEDKSTDVAEEIFAEIERLLDLNALSGDIFTGKYFDVDLKNDIAELKKKYIGKDTNVPAKTEGEK